MGGGALEHRHAAGLGACHRGGRHLGTSIPPSPAAARRCAADGRHRTQLRRTVGVLAAARGRFPGYAEPEFRRCQCIPAARARSTGRGRARQCPHHAVRPLQPDRCVVCRARRTRGRRSGRVGEPGGGSPCGIANHVRRLWRGRPRRLAAVSAACRCRRFRRRPIRRRRSGPRAASSSGWLRCSRSTRSPAGWWCSRCWRCGCSSDSTCR